MYLFWEPECFPEDNAVRNLVRKREKKKVFVLERQEKNVIESCFVQI